jgi:hypothetical protein
MNKFNSGFSLIETIVGIALMLIVFISLFISLQLGIQIIGRSKAKAGALALANEQMEMIHNFAYDDIGTVSGIPSGSIPQEETITLNDIEYTRRTLIQYVDAPEDGLAENDENGIVADYKRVKVEVSWQGRYFSNPISLISDFMPKGIETDVGGGTLIIQVIDANSLPVSLANVHIENASTSVSIDVFTNDQGKVIFPGTPASGGYEINVTKSGYSSAQTYDAVQPNVNPDPGHLLILEGETTQATFSIDKVSAKEIRTVGPPGQDVWSDSFNDESKIFATSSVVIEGGEATLATTTSGAYESYGFIISETVNPFSLSDWIAFSWNDNQPASTTIRYQLLYFDGMDWVLIPEADLPGNSSGFASSPIDLSFLATTTYNELRLQANLSTEDASITPLLLDWQINWQTGSMPVGDVAFHMQGSKVIGKDINENPIYKYDNDLATDSFGYINISNLEWDVYNITIDGSFTGYDISESCPPQPVSILPDTANSTVLTLVSHSNNTLLAVVKESSGDLVAGASVRLYKAGYDKTQVTSNCGQTFFTSLSSAADYSIEVTKAGYENFNLANIEIDGQSRIEIILNEI